MSEESPPYGRCFMSWPYLLVFAFIASQATVMLMLTTSGMYSELFGRSRRIARAHEAARQLEIGDQEWVENHEFWELGEVEEVAF